MQIAKSLRSRIRAHDARDRQRAAHRTHARHVEIMHIVDGAAGSRDPPSRPATRPSGTGRRRHRPLRSVAASSASACVSSLLGLRATQSIAHCARWLGNVWQRRDRIAKCTSTSRQCSSRGQLVAAMSGMRNSRACAICSAARRCGLDALRAPPAEHRRDAPSGAGSRRWHARSRRSRSVGADARRACANTCSRSGRRNRGMASLRERLNLAGFENSLHGSSPGTRRDDVSRPSPVSRCRASSRASSLSPRWRRRCAR